MKTTAYSYGLLTVTDARDSLPRVCQSGQCIPYSDRIA